ncbi:MAG: sugar phosphate isomerase/epimerase family protein [bacterium]
MKIGLMNNPRNDLLSEIDFIASSDFDFIDLTLEFPACHLSLIDQKSVLDRIAETGLSVVGHTAYYLPFASPIPAIREAAVRDVNESVEFFKKAGARIITLHPDSGIGAIDLETTITLNANSFSEIVRKAKEHGLEVVMENIPGVFSHPGVLRQIFDRVGELGFHLDVAHSSIGRDNTRQLLNTFKGRLKHIHLSDNRLREDDHMPIGAGNIRWEQVISLIKATGYDSSFTLEVFCPDRRYAIASREKFLDLWNK